MTDKLSMYFKNELCHCDLDLWRCAFFTKIAMWPTLEFIQLFFLLSKLLDINYPKNKTSFLVKYEVNLKVIINIVTTN